MTQRIFFTLWRAGVIALLGLVLDRLYGWEPAPLVIAAMIAIAIDSAATLWTMMRQKG